MDLVTTLQASTSARRKYSNTSLLVARSAHGATKQSLELRDPTFYCLNNAARNKARPNIRIRTASTEDNDRRTFG